MAVRLLLLLAVEAVGARALWAVIPLGLTRVVLEVSALTLIRLGQPQLLQVTLVITLAVEAAVATTLVALAVLVVALTVWLVTLSLTLATLTLVAVGAVVKRETLAVMAVQES
jgi:hypothetical protein